MQIIWATLIWSWNPKATCKTARSSSIGSMADVEALAQAAIQLYYSQGALGEDISP